MTGHLLITYTNRSYTIMFRHHNFGTYEPIYQEFEGVHTVLPEFFVMDPYNGRLPTGYILRRVH